MRRTRDRPLAGGKSIASGSTVPRFRNDPGWSGRPRPHRQPADRLADLDNGFPLRRHVHAHEAHDVAQHVLGQHPRSAASGGRLGSVATRHFDTGAWVLFAILFAWQNPHFYAIAWIFREDCRRGGFKMRPVLEEDGGCTSRHILAFSVLLIAVSILPTLLGTSGILYLRGAPDPRSRHVRHRRLVDAHSVHPRCPLPAAGVGRRSSIYLCCSSSR